MDGQKRPITRDEHHIKLVVLIKEVPVRDKVHSIKNKLTIAKGNLQIIIDDKNISREEFLLKISKIIKAIEDIDELAIKIREMCICLGFKNKKGV